MGELKRCPFCGGFVIFEKEEHTSIYEGTCIECTMQFRYEEKQEEIVTEHTSGMVIKQYIMPSKKRLNLPFTEAWNRRADNDKR